MTMFGTKPGLYPGELTPDTLGMLPGETWFQYLHRLYRERDYDQNQQMQDERTRMQFGSQYRQQQARDRADRARMAADASINRNRNQMTLADLRNSMARDNLQPTGSLTNMYKSALGGY